MISAHIHARSTPTKNRGRYSRGHRSPASTELCDWWVLLDGRGNVHSKPNHLHLNWQQFLSLWILLFLFCWRSASRYGCARRSRLTSIYHARSLSPKTIKTKWTALLIFRFEMVHCMRNGEIIITTHTFSLSFSPNERRRRGRCNWLLSWDIKWLLNFNANWISSEKCLAWLRASTGKLSARAQAHDQTPFRFAKNTFHRYISINNSREIWMNQKYKQLNDGHHPSHR